MLNDRQLLLFILIFWHIISGSRAAFWLCVGDDVVVSIVVVVQIKEKKVNEQKEKTKRKKKTVQNFF